MASWFAPGIQTAKNIGDSVNNELNRVVYGSNYPSPSQPKLYAPQAAERALTEPNSDLTSLTGDAISESFSHFQTGTQDFFGNVARGVEDSEASSKKFSDSLLTIALVGIGTLIAIKI
jgi:hypothetical protein